MIQVTYKKKNGDIINRIRNTYTPYKIGEYTSMGWKVIDIKYFYKGKYYPMEIYDNLINKDWANMKRMIKLKAFLKRLYSDFICIFIFLVFARVFLYMADTIL